MASRDEVQVSVLTPAGRGAVATVGVRGGGAVALVGRCFVAAKGGPLESFPIGRVVFGRFALGDAASEELVVGLVGPDEVEVHCHGGVAAAAAVSEALVAAGAASVSWEQWLSGTALDSIAAAALLALPQARTQRTAAILLDQYRGALHGELLAIEELLRSGQTQPARERIELLLSRTELGRHLTQPWRVVLAGRPNAGKSSLINALLGYQRAIVFEQPGTTRDVLTATTAIDGWPVELADTAGLRSPGDAIEAAGVERAQTAISGADLVLLVADTTAPWDAVLHTQVATARRLLIVHNKCDLAPPPADRPLGVAVSTKTGEGTGTLCAAIAASLVPQPPPAGAAVPFTAEQVAALAALLRRCGEN